MPTVSLNYTQAGEQITRDEHKWGDALGTSAVISYGFRPTGQTVPFLTGSNHLEFSGQQKIQAQYVLDLIMSIANVTFQLEGPGSGPAPDNPDLYMSTYSDSTDGAGGNAILPDFPYGGNVFIDRFGYNQASLDMLPGTQGFDTLLHEIGHGLGLQHPADYNASDDEAPTYDANAFYFEDTNQFTMMSYFATRNEAGVAVATPFATTPLLHDIAALQRLYGANWNTRTGSDVYGFNGTAGQGYTLTSAAQNTAFAIWDGGGIDTLDFSLYADNQVITLRAATANQASAEVPFSSVGGNFKNVVIAPGVVIENAIGGSGADRLIGNTLGNTLNGGMGADVMIGGHGADIYYVDDVGDVVDDSGSFGDTGTIGDDFAVDQIYSNVSFSLMGTGVERLKIVPILGNFSLTGNTGINFLEGNNGSNTFVGNGGGNAAVLGSGDIFVGGLGNDTYYVNYQDLTAEFAGGGFDTVYAYGDYTIRAGYEIEELRAVNFQGPGVRFTGNEAATRFMGTTGYDDIDGGAGNDVIQGNFISLASTQGNRLSGGAGFDTIVGDNGTDIVSGGADDDSIDTKSGNDSIEGGSGADTINAGLGTDTASYSSSGGGVTVALQQWTFATNNFLVVSNVAAGARSGDAQGDVLTSIEDLRGSSHADTLVGDLQVNTLEGGNGNDRLAGAGGNDFLYGGNGADRMDGGDGNDLLEGDEAPAATNYVSGNDILSGGAGNDRLIGGQSNDTLFGGDGNDVLSGDRFLGDVSDTDSFSAVLNGTISNDSDYLAGGAGNDIYYIGGKEDVISEAINGGTDELRMLLTDDNFDLSVSGFENIENMTYLSSYNARFVTNEFGIPDIVFTVGAVDFFGTGNALANRITGNIMNDTLKGLGGNDSLIGGAGIDNLDGGADDDTLNGGADGDTLVGGNGSDTVSYSTSGVGVKAAFESVAVGDSIFSFLIQAGFTGGDAAGDIVSGFENIIGSAYKDTLVGSGIANVLSGGNGNDSLYGKEGADTLKGGAADDYLVGGTGADLLYGGSGNDTYLVDDVGDVVSEQSSLLNFFIDDGGLDSVSTKLSSYTLTNYIEKLSYTGFGAFTGIGNDSDNTISGGLNADDLDGGAGNDTLNGGVGADKLTGGAGNDSLNGGEGDDTMYLGSGINFADGGAGFNVLSYYARTDGAIINMANQLLNAGSADSDTFINIGRINGSNTGADNLNGDANANYLVGYGGIDTLNGGGGDDTLRGGVGADIISGGVGADKFRYDAVNEGGDVISSLSSIDDFQFLRTAFGNLAGDYVEAVNFLSRTSGNAATTTDHRFIFDQSTEQLWFDSNGTGSGGLTLIATIGSNTTLLNTDLILV